MSIKHSTLAVAALLAVNFAVAQTAAPKAPEPSSTMSYNLGVVSDYRYRGMSQSGLKPALQGGLDYVNKNGFYAGAWASTISWIKDTGAAQTPKVDTGNSSVELDLYAGYKFEATKGIMLDVGALQYLYPGNKLANLTGASNANTLEVYGAMNIGVMTVKYSHAMTNLFGTGLTTGITSTKSSNYLDVSATIDLSNGYSVVPHFGAQKVQNTPTATYLDYSIALNKEIDGLVLSGTIHATKTPNNGAYIATAPNGKNLGKGALVLSVKKNF